MRNSRALQTSIYSFMKDSFRHDAIVAAKKSVEQARNILLEPDVNGSEIAAVVCERSYGNAKRMSESSRNPAIRTAAMINPEELLKITHDAYKSDIFLKQLAEYDLIFEEGLVEDVSYTSIVNRLLIKENRDILAKMEKEHSKMKKLLNKVMNMNSVAMGRNGGGEMSFKPDNAFNPIGILSVAYGFEESRPHAERKIFEIAQVMLENGFPGYRDRLYEKVDMTKHREHMKSLHSRFGNGEATFKPGRGENKIYSTFEIGDYAEHDPLEESKKVKEYTDQARMWQNILEEVDDYKIDTRTEKLIGMLEQKALSVASLKTEILGRKNYAEVFNYLQEVFSSERAKSVVRDYTGSSSGKAIDRVMSKLIAFYGTVGPNRREVAAKVEGYARKVQTAERYVSRLRSIEEIKRRASQETQLKTAYDVSHELAKLPITMFTN